MKNEVKAAVVQFNIRTGNVDVNLKQARNALNRLAVAGCQFAVLPEMWSTGYAYRDINRLALRTTEVIEELCNLSKRHNMVIVGSLPEPHGDKVYNTAYVMDHGEMVGSYRKLHLFSMLGENRMLEGGDSWLVVNTHAGRLGVLICYDLRFPELSRRLALEGAEIIVVPSEWPKPREEHWRILLKARAIENQLFVVAANCCGVQGKLDFFGESLIIGPKGEVLTEGGYEPCEMIATLDFSAMESWRRQIPCFVDRRPECY